MAVDQTGADALWIRAFDAQSSQILAGTQGASLPFWSADRLSIGFFKDLKLVVVPAAIRATSRTTRSLRRTTGSVIAAGNQPSVPLSQLTWFDQSGARLGVLGDAAHVWGFVVDPGRARLVVERYDFPLNSGNPWIVDINSGFATPMRALVEGALANNPIWSSDGQKVFFNSGYGTMRVASVNGAIGDAWPVGANSPGSSSPDGTVVMITQQSSGTASDLMVVPLTGDHTPVPYLQTSFSEGAARFSPDGKSVAYVSNESNRFEVYIETFPRSARKVRVSSAGGIHPEWSEDGRELYFVETRADGTRSLMVKSVPDGLSLPARRLFDLPPGRWEINRRQFASFDHGRRFLVNVPVPITAPQVITIGQNWTAALGPKR